MHTGARTKSLKNRGPSKGTTSHGVGVVVKWLLILCHVVLCYFFYFKQPLTYMGGIMVTGIVISALYWFTYRGKLFTDMAVERGIRHVLAYILTTMTAVFYTIAMIRSDQLNDTVTYFIIGGSFFLYYCLFSASKGLIKR